MTTAWGPLAALAGDWEGDDGVDWAYSHRRDELVSTPFRERVQMVPFGPILNGDQHLYGLDCRTAMWRDGEVDPFHAEVGYWLWDGGSEELLRGFVVRRGITVLAGGTARADAAHFALAATKDDPDYSIAENRYLARRARSLSYRVSVEVHSDETWSYDAVTELALDELDAPFAHTDRNTLRRSRSPWPSSDDAAFLRGDRRHDDFELR
ncbi:MAG TPA: heme-binding beta-barrel domain-containing protein [Acidimicrobiales bacterium]|nr:heme-binding beta-barrel domain-containing protein [Acidimicrobiales bacterium]